MFAVSPSLKCIRSYKYLERKDLITLRCLLINVLRTYKATLIPEGHGILSLTPQKVCKRSFHMSEALTTIIYTFKFIFKM